MSDSDISNFSYCSETRRQNFLVLSRQLDEQTNGLYQFYVAFFAIVDFIGDVKNNERTLRGLRHFLWDARMGKTVYPKTRLEQITYKFITLLQGRDIDEKTRYQVYWHLNKHLLNTIRYSKSVNKLKSADEIKEYRQKEIIPWTDGLLVLLKPRLSVRSMSEIARVCAYIIQIADDIVDVYTDLNLGIVNFPKEDVLKYVQGLEIKDDEVVGTDPKRLNIKMEYLVSQFNEAEASFDATSKMLIKIRESAKDEKTKAIIDTLRGLTYSFLDDARQVCYKHVVPQVFMTSRIYF